MHEREKRVFVCVIEREIDVRGRKQERDRKRERVYRQFLIFRIDNPDVLFKNNERKLSG